MVNSMEMMILGITTSLVILGFGSNEFLFHKGKKLEKKLYQLNLEQLSKYDGWLISKECFLDNGSLANREEAMNRKGIDIVYPYVETLVSNLTEEEIKLMYTNLKTLEVESEKDSIFKTKSGTYSSVDNIIFYCRIDAISHELLHMASSFYDEKLGIIQCGFKQSTIKDADGNELEDGVEVGSALNEGYTELLNARFFNKKDKDISYERYVKVARLFELFFDDPKEMRLLFFHHDLPGFVHYMEKFMPYDKVIDIILKLDKSLAYANFNDNISKKEYLEVLDILYDYFIKSNKGLEKNQLFVRIMKGKLSVYKENQMICNSPAGDMLPFENEEYDSNLNSEGIKRMA